MEQATLCIPDDHTFVVPAYRASRHLADCLRSLAGQTVRSHVLVTTSTPNAAIEATAHSFGVPVLVNQDRRSIGADWNFALGAAPTRLVTLAHQDDIYAPTFLAETLALFGRRPTATAAFTRCRHIGSDGQVRNDRVLVVKDVLLTLFAGRHETVAGLRARALLSFGNPVACSAMTFARERLGAFRFDETLASNLDWAAWLSLVERGDTLALTHERLVMRRYDSATETSRLIANGRRRAEDRMMFERLWPRAFAWAILQLYTLGY